MTARLLCARSTARGRHLPAAATARLRCPRGQSSVELVALLPVVLLLGVGLLALLSARSAAGDAAAAAQAGAMALIQDDGAAAASQSADRATAAARAALPSGARRRAQIRVRGRRITVTVRPPATPAFVGGTLASTASADAGPEPPR